VVLAHPQLPAPVAEALGIVRLEAAVLEVLDASEEPEALAEIQVPFMSDGHVGRSCLGSGVLHVNHITGKTVLIFFRCLVIIPASRTYQRRMMPCNAGCCHLAAC